jgi:hypothetical protein
VPYFKPGKELKELLNREEEPSQQPQAAAPGPPEGTVVPA